MTLEEYKKNYNEDSAPGWAAIDNALAKIYGEGEPKYHWGTMIRYDLGGPDPLDGISCYESTTPENHLHYCTYGFSSLNYDEEIIEKEFSGYGFELTFRLKSDFPAKEDPIWFSSILQNLARYVFQSGNWFEEYQWADLTGAFKEGSNLAGAIFVQDKELGLINTCHGEVEFLQIFAITYDELNDIKDKKRTTKEIIDSHLENNPYLISDLNR